MSKKEINLFDKRQAFLFLFTLQLIIHSADNVEALQRKIKEEIKKHNIRPERIRKVQQPEESEDNEEEGIMNPEAMGMVKSILSNEPPTMNKFNPLYQKNRPVVPSEEVSTVKPVEIKVKRVEMPAPTRQPPRFLKIPEARLPPEFQYLRPTPVAREIDLGKLNPLVNDPAVQTIECEAPEKPIIVTGMMGRKPTGIILSNDEAEDTINRFSQASKIPADEGIYKVVVGRLVLSAVISDVVPSRFMIRKMRLPNPSMQISRNPNQPPRMMFGR